MGAVAGPFDDEDEAAAAVMAVVAVVPTRRLSLSPADFSSSVPSVEIDAILAVAAASSNATMSAWSLRS